MDKRQIEIEVLKEAVKEHCQECDNNEPVTFDPDMQHYYHFDGDLGCRASGLHRMISERMSTPYIPNGLSNENPPTSCMGTHKRHMDSAPRDGTRITVETHSGCEFRAFWTGNLLGRAGQECGGWAAANMNDHPPCWDDGICWEVNAAGEPSDPPIFWKP